MKFYTLPFVFTFSLLFAVEWVSARTILSPQGTLDKEAIRKIYFEGEFQELKELLEKYNKETPSTSEEDKILIYKYLGIIYATDPSTKDKSESYLFQLLKLRPTLEVLDMYISEDIKLIFENVKRDYQSKAKYFGEESSLFNTDSSNQNNKPSADTSGSLTGAKGGGTEIKAGSKGGNGWIWWTSGGVVVAGSVTAYLLLSSPETTVKEKSRGTMTLED